MTSGLNTCIVSTALTDCTCGCSKENDGELRDAPPIVHDGLEAAEPSDNHGLSVRRGKQSSLKLMPSGLSVEASEGPELEAAAH